MQWIGLIKRSQSASAAERCLNLKLRHYRLPGEVDYPPGIVAGDRFLDPMGLQMIPGRNDGRVSVERTRLAGMADHLTIHATHHGMVRNRHAIGHVLALPSGRAFQSAGRGPGRRQNPRMMSPASVKLPVLVRSL